MKDKKISIRLDETQREAIERIAKSQEIPMSQVLRQAISEYLAKKEG